MPVLVFTVLREGQAIRANVYNFQKSVLYAQIFCIYQ